MTAAVLCQVGDGDGQEGSLYGSPYTQMFLGPAPELQLSREVTNRAKGKSGGSTSGPSGSGADMNS